MFIVTTTPEHPTKLRRSGTQGGSPRPCGSVRTNSNTCRSYGAWPAAARLATNMALLTELPATPPLLPRRAKSTCMEQSPLPPSNFTNITINPTTACYVFHPTTPETQTLMPMSRTASR